MTTVISFKLISLPISLGISPVNLNCYKYLIVNNF